MTAGLSVCVAGLVRDAAEVQSRRPRRIHPYRVSAWATAVGGLRACNVRAHAPPGRPSHFQCVTTFPIGFLKDDKR